MNKLTKLLSVFVIAGAMVGAGGALAGCNKGNNDNNNDTPACEHTYTYKSDGASGHHQECDKCDDKTAVVGHNYGNDNVCDDCGYDKTVHVADVTISGETVVDEEQTIQLTANITPENADNKTVIWSIAREYAEFAEISTDGALTGKKAGEVKVTATVDGQKAEFTVTVEKKANPHEISRVKDLLAFRALTDEAVNADENKTYKLMNNIDLEGVVLGAPTVVLGEGITFDGQGYTISNATYTDAGAKEGILIKTILGGTVKDVKFLSCSISSSNETVAIIAGECNATSEFSKIEFNACSAVTTNNYAGLIFGRVEGNKSNATITMSEITAKNGCVTSCAQYGGFLVGDLTATTTVVFQDLDVAGEFKGSSGNGSFIAGRTRDGATVSVENAVINAEMPVANSIGIFAGGGAAKMTLKNILITKTNNAALGATNKTHTVTKENVVTVEGVTVTDATATDGVESVDYLKDTLSFNFEETWMEEGEGGYRLKAASTNVKSADATIDKLKINTGNVTTRFKVGEEFSAAGLVVMGAYSDGVQLVLANETGYTVDASAVKTDAAGEYKVVVKSVEDETKTAEYTVVVAAKTGFKVYDEFMDHTYVVGGKLDTANLVVKSTWSDGIEEYETVEVDAASYDMTTAGKYNVSISHGEYDAQTVEITVIAAPATATENKVTVKVDAASTVDNGTAVEGVATFKTLGAAIQYLEASKLDNDVVKVVNIAEGIYKEKITTDLCNLTLIGEGDDKSVLTYSAVESTVDIVKKSQYGLNCATLHINGTNFTAKNLTIRNDFDYINESKNESSPQGLALTIAGDQAEIVDCHLYGNQDTLYLKAGRAYFKNTLIEGNVDFIFGEQTGIAFFEECEVKSITRFVDKVEGDKVNRSNNGYVTAMKADSGNKPDYGYIFYKTKFTDDGKLEKGSMSLARPWGPAATVAFIECSFTEAYATGAYGAKDDDNKDVKGRWEQMSGNSPANADFCEYGSTGAGAITEAVNGGKVLTEEQAAKYTMENAFAMVNGKCAWKTPWAGTNEKVMFTVKNAEEEDIYAGELCKGIKLTEELANQLFEVSGMTFAGLFVDVNFETPFDYTLALSAPTTLYAKYEAKAGKTTTYTYTYGSENDAAWAINGNPATATSEDSTPVTAYKIMNDANMTLAATGTKLTIKEMKGFTRGSGNAQPWAKVELLDAEDKVVGTLIGTTGTSKLNADITFENNVCEAEFVKVRISSAGAAGKDICITTVTFDVESSAATASTKYDYAYGGENGSEWTTEGTPNTTKSTDATPVTALKVESGKSLILTASGTKATVSVTGFTTSSSNASEFLDIEFLDASGAVVGSLKGTTPAGKVNGDYAFTTNEYSGTAFTSVRFTCNTSGKGCGIVTVSIEIS